MEENKSTMLETFDEYARRNVYAVLSNKEVDKANLKSRPHRTFLGDCVISYRIFLEKENGMVCVIVTNELAKELKLSEAELNRMALQNTERIFPAVFGDMSTFLKEADLECQALEEADLCEDTVDVVFLTNKRKIHGAATMVYMENLRKIADIFGSDFFILPSSIHEVICVRKSYIPDEIDLKEILKFGNTETIQPEEKLSDKVFYYDRSSEKLSVVAGS